MKIICIVKFIPDGDCFEIKGDKPVSIGEGCRLRINPDDECALGLALKIKKSQPDTFIELLTMGPKSLKPLVEDIVRVGIDRATIISDQMYDDSDAWVTSQILARYLCDKDYGCLFSGSSAKGVGSSCVPPSIADMLGLCQLSGITRVDEDNFSRSKAVVDIEDDGFVSSFEMDLPAILSFSHKSGYRLPYVRLKNRNLDVTHKLTFLSNAELGFDSAEIGLRGSRTKFAGICATKSTKTEPQVVGIDQQGIDIVFNLLKEKRII